MRCVKVSTAACTSHTAECFCRMGTDALRYRDDVIAPAGERHPQTENVTQAKMSECRASSAPRVRRHVEVLHCSRYVRVRFLHALEHKFPAHMVAQRSEGVLRNLRQTVIICGGVGRGSRLAAVTQQVCVVESSALGRPTKVSAKLREHKIYVTITAPFSPPSTATDLCPREERGRVLKSLKLSTSVWDEP